MGSVNKVILVGNLGKDPEIRHYEGGGIIARFSLATSENYKTRDGKKVEHTEWHNIVLFKTIAENLEKLNIKKGQLICIEGKIRTHSWEDKDGNKKSTTEIIADNMTLLGKRVSEGEQHGITVNSTLPVADETIHPINPDTIPDSTGDLPF